jgi:ribosomal protein S18 acetylase RimI-like enzyme
VVSITLEFKHVGKWDTDQIIDLYKAGSWWKDTYDPSGIPPLIAGSFDFVVAVDDEEGRAVGMGRTISDGVSDAYIQDVVVFPDRRGEGIGRKIVGELLDHARNHGLSWIGLIAEKDSRGFYEPLGFREFRGTPMLFEGEEKQS